jgi:uncharacterized protein YifN (PemK superfamily)
MEDEKAAGSGMVRTVSRERMERMRSAEGEERTVAMCLPSGLGWECAEADDGVSKSHQ